MKFDRSHYESLTIVAIDPGLNNIGLSVFTLDVKEELIIKSIDARTLKADKVADWTNLDPEYRSEQIMKCYRMVDAVMYIIRNTNPSIVVCESPFFDRRKPSSFAVLSNVLSILFDRITQHNPNIQIHTVEPLLVKHVLKVAGQKGKEVVREAMEKESFLLSVLKQPLGVLDEHAIDSIGVGYTFIKRKLK